MAKAKSVKLLFTIKNYSLLMSYLNKYKGFFKNQTVVDFYNDSFTIKTTSDPYGASDFKVSKILYKDVFEEVEIELPEKYIIMSFYMKIEKFINYLSNFDNNSTIEFECFCLQEIPSARGVVNDIVSSKNNLLKDLNQFYVVDNIKFAGKKLKISMNSSDISLNLELLRLSRESANRSLESKSIAEFVLESSTIKTIHNLVKSFKDSDVKKSQDEVILFKGSGHTMNIQIPGYFDYEVELNSSVAEPFEAMYPFTLFDAIETEDLEVKIKDLRGNGSGYGLLFKYLESDTFCLISYKVGVK